MATASNDATEGNVISGQQHGRRPARDRPARRTADNNVIAGNRIGTSADGNTALANGRMGVFSDRALAIASELIPTESPTLLERNIISGNREAGIYHRRQRERGRRQLTSAPMRSAMHRFPTAYGVIDAECEQ